MYIFQFNEDLIINEPATATLSFHNPLERALTGCEFRLTSTAIAGRTLRFQAADVPPKGLVTAEIPVQPNVSTVTLSERKVRVCIELYYSNGVYV
jgi:hypothetical protein